jgi:hypothetical protein
MIAKITGVSGSGSCIAALLSLRGSTRERPIAIPHVVMACTNIAGLRA